MEDKIDKAIETLVGKINQPIQPEQAVKYTQAALNLAHVRKLSTEGNKPSKAKGAGAT
jgi:hypothetical protein